MDVDAITFVEISEKICFGADTYKKDIVLEPGVYEVVEWSHHNQRTQYEYDYVQLISMKTNEKIHFILYNPDKYCKKFTVHSEFLVRH